jgi:hypothetical protein
MKMQLTPWRVSLLILAASYVVLAPQFPVRAADQPSSASCDQFMAPKRTVTGKTIGQEACLMQDAGIVDAANQYHRVEMGITGTLAGWIVKEGARSNHFTSAPDFVFTQMGNMRERFHATLRYEAEKGTSLTLLYPEKNWNGKFFMMVHGVGGSFLKGSMKPWDQVFNPARPMGDVTKYEKAMLAKGYAVARTRRNADRETPGDYEAVLDDGTHWPGQNINQNPELILDMAKLVRNYLKDRLGREATRIYWYGHSAGAHMGLLVNYIPEVNKDNGGKPLISGFIDDDPGGGLYIPVLMNNGQDVLFRTPAEREKFVKSIIVAHQLYPNVYSEDTPWEMELKTIPKFVSPNYLANKRTTARVMKEKGVGGYRMYEVKGVSHNGGESLGDVADRLVGDRDIDILDLSRLIDGVVDLLDNWVEKGVEPPPTKSEAAGLGGKGDAINLPETACPLGVYFAYPPLHSLEGVGSTAFAPFDGGDLEPVDGRLVFVDMNGDGKRDKRETVAQAWQRLGLLKAGESFNRAKYSACVQQAAAQLRKDKFITQQVADVYVQEANTKDLPQQ